MQAAGCRQQPSKASPSILEPRSRSHHAGNDQPLSWHNPIGIGTNRLAVFRIVVDHQPLVRITIIDNRAAATCACDSLIFRHPRYWRPFSGNQGAAFGSPRSSHHATSAAARQLLHGKENPRPLPSAAVLGDWIGCIEASPAHLPLSVLGASSQSQVFSRKS